MICLKELFVLNTESGEIHSLAFSKSGNLGFATSSGCGFIFDSKGNLLNKVCGDDWMVDASYSNGKFGFINWDGHAYITDESGNLIKKVKVGGDYSWAITMTPNGFMACYTRCAFFDFNGNKLWDADFGYAINGPTYYKGYWYVADVGWKKLLIIKDGKIVNSISYGESAGDTAVCGKYLAVVTDNHLYLYDLSDPENPKKVWKVGGIDVARQIAFSPDCKYIAVADMDEHKLKVYNILGNLVLEKHYGDRDKDKVTAVAWWRDRIAVGFYDGRVYVYSVRTPKLFFSLLPA